MGTISFNHYRQLNKILFNVENNAEFLNNSEIQFGEKKVNAYVYIRVLLHAFLLDELNDMNFDQIHNFVKRFTSNILDKIEININKIGEIPQNGIVLIRNFVVILLNSILIEIKKIEF
jgi:hypothetical protein